MCAYSEGFLAGKEAEDDVGGGRGGDVVVLGGEAEQEVAYAAAGEVGLVACGAQCLGDVAGCEVLRVR